MQEDVGGGVSNVCRVPCSWRWTSTCHQPAATTELLADWQRIRDGIKVETTLHSSSINKKKVRYPKPLQKNAAWKETQAYNGSRMRLGGGNGLPKLL